MAVASAAAVLLLACGASAEPIFPNGRPGCQGPPEACPDLRRDDTVQLQIKHHSSFESSRSRVNETLRGSVLSCLKKEMQAKYVIDPSKGGYDNAKKMVNDWSGTAGGVESQLKPEPVVIAQVQSKEDAARAVFCAKKFGIQACARSGQHGWDNEGGCDKGLLVDVQDLLKFNLNKDKKTVWFGAGNWLGRIYNKLYLDGNAKYYVPVGVVSCVGPGLILGCGRGLATSVKGLACDAIKAIRYIDADGNEQQANKNQNQDMFWMAKGGAGEFPGIITEFKMKANRAPNDVWTTQCDYTNYGQATSAMKEWFNQNPAMLDPDRKAYTALSLFNGAKTSIKLYCLGCNQGEKNWVQDRMNAINGASGYGGSCSQTTKSWLDQILYESGAPNGANWNWLLNRENGYGKNGNINTRGPQIANGRVSDSWNVPTSIINAITSGCWNGQGEPYSMFCGVYPITGEKVTKVGEQDTAYGGRDIKWTFHYKYGMAKGQSSGYYNSFKQASVNFQNELDKWMPCRNFYNYIDTDGMVCNGGESKRGSKKWLNAYFSNATKMQEIKLAVDPDDVIRSIGLPDAAD